MGLEMLVNVKINLREVWSGSELTQVAVQWPRLL